MSIGRKMETLRIAFDIAALDRGGAERASPCEEI